MMFRLGGREINSFLRDEKERGSRKIGKYSYDGTVDLSGSGQKVQAELVLKTDQIGRGTGGGRRDKVARSAAVKRPLSGSSNKKGDGPHKKANLQAY